MSKSLELKFRFNNSNVLKAKKIVKKYPKNFSRSAILPLLHLAQEQLDGWLNKSAIEYISNYSYIICQVLSKCTKKVYDFFIQIY